MSADTVLSLPDPSGAEWQVPSEQAVRLEVRVNGAEAEVTIPGLDAWDVGWLKIF